MKPIALALALVLAAPAARAALPRTPSSCTLDEVARDVSQTLIGGIEISNLRIFWATDDEGRDLVGYEIWARRSDVSRRLEMRAPLGRCRLPAVYDVSVAYLPDFAYYLEVHGVDGSIRAFPVPIR